MSETLFELTFYGRLVDGVNLETAKSNVTTLFKASPAQVDKMFTGSRVVIRNKLDQATATKYIAIMRKNGLVCETEVMGGAASTPAPNDTASPSPASASPSPANPAVQPAAEQHSAPQVAPSKPMEVASKSGLNVAGDKVDDILQQSHLGLDPVGIRLSEHEEVEAPVFSGLDEITIAPAGAVLADEKEAPPVIVPDTSGISIAPVGTNLADQK